MLVPPRVCKREDGAVREGQHTDPWDPWFPTVFLCATHDNRLGSRPEHPPAPAQDARWHPAPQDEWCQSLTAKASFPPAQPDWERDPGTAVAAGEGVEAQVPLRRERQLEHGPGNQAESLGGQHSPPASGELGAAHGESEQGLGAEGAAGHGRGTGQPKSPLHSLGPLSPEVGVTREPQPQEP